MKPMNVNTICEHEAVKEQVFNPFGTRMFVITTP